MGVTPETEACPAQRLVTDKGPSAALVPTEDIRQRYKGRSGVR